MPAIFSKIGKFLKPLSAALRGRYLIVIIFLIIFVALVWLVGHKISFDGREILNTFSAKLSATLILLLAGGAVAVALSASDRKAEKKDPEAAEARRRAAEEALKLKAEKFYIRKKIDEALTITKAKYALPWYLIIGPKNCGKTSALWNSGLKFPVNEENSRARRKEVAATDKVELYYGNQAVFIDTPGLYTEADQKEPKHKIWLELLKRIFKARPGRPLNGVIVCLSLRDLIDTDHDHRDHLARSIRDRLGELSRRLHTRAPVYLLLTKGDVLPGFSQFFARLSKNDREQICGTTIAEEDFKPGRIRHELGHLLVTLNSQLLHKMHEERDASSRGSLFRFPQELAAIAPDLEDFIFGAFGESRYHDPVLFRGFFLTSSLSGHEAVLKENPEEAALLRYDVSRSWTSADDLGFFLSGLFSKLFVNEAGLAGSARFQWHRIFDHQAAKALILICFGLALFFMVRSFDNNFNRVQDLEQHYAEFERARAVSLLPLEAKTVLPELKILQSASRIYNPDEDGLLQYGLGLYQGHRLRAAVLNAWKGDLNTRLLPLLRKYAERRVRRSLDNIEELKESLRGYVMLMNPKYLEEDFLTIWQADRWSSQYQGDAPVQAALAEQLGTMIRLGWNEGELNAELMALARKAMFKVPPPETAYRMIKEAAAREAKPPFTFRNVMGTDVTLFYGDTFEVPYLYTKAGFEEYLVARGPDFIRALTTDGWIFGEDESGWSLTEQDISRIHSAAGRLYYRDYIRFWNEAVQSLNVRRPESLAEAGRMAETIGGGGSPVITVLSALRNNITLNAELMPAIRDDEAIQMEGDDQPIAETEEAQASESALPPADASMVHHYFAQLDALLLDDGLPSGSLGAANNAAVEAGAYFTMLAASDDVEEKILDSLISLADETDTGLKKMAISAAKLPPQVNRWYSIILDSGLDRLRHRGADYLNAVYREDVLNVYNAALRDRFPFNPLAATDVNLEDFKDFFRAGGQADSFISSYLKPFLNQSGNLRAIMGKPLPLSAKAVEQLGRVSLVREAFFAGGTELGVTFSLAPNTMDKVLKSASLTYGEKTISYWHGPAITQSFTWPGGFKSALTFEDLAGNIQERAAGGEWSIFRLFQGGARQGGIVEVRIKDSWIRFNVRYRNRVSPFNAGIYGYHPPDSLK